MRGDQLVVGGVQTQGLEVTRKGHTKSLSKATLNGPDPDPCRTAQILHADGPAKVSVDEGPRGLDGLVFTAGIGENSAEVRRRICEACSWLGVRLDTEANEASGPRITTRDSEVSAWVIPTNEELMIARHTAAEL